MQSLHEGANLPVFLVQYVLVILFSIYAFERLAVWETFWDSVQQSFLPLPENMC